jgi:hypothetical protein
MCTTNTSQQVEEDFKMSKGVHKPEKPDSTANTEYQRFCERVGELRNNHIVLPIVKTQARIDLENALNDLLDVSWKSQLPTSCLETNSFFHQMIRDQIPYLSDTELDQLVDGLVNSAHQVLDAKEREDAARALAQANESYEPQIRQANL